MFTDDDGGRFAFEPPELVVLTSMMAAPERPNLAALWFEPSKGQAWATDGFRAVLAEVRPRPPKAPATGPVLGIYAETAVQVAKLARAGELVVVDLRQEAVRVEVRAPRRAGVRPTSFVEIDEYTEHKHGLTCRRHEHNPPKIQGFFPRFQDRGSKGATMAFNPALLQSIVILGKVAKPSKRVWINIGDAQGDPMLAVAESDESVIWRVLVMPKAGAATEHPDYHAKAGATADPMGEAAAPPKAKGGKRKGGSPKAA